MKKILLITGAYPPDICGVGDYVYNLLSSGNTSQWDLYYSKNWSIRLLRKKISEINNFDREYIYMQYPTLGYKWSILPQLLCIYYSIFTYKKFIVVLHEFSQRTLKAKLATLCFFFANGIIFTNEFEKKYALKIFPFKRKHFYVVKIFSNIKSVPHLNTWSNRKYDLVYFGHIRPNKGMEDFFNVVSKVQSQRSLKVAIIGQILPEFINYLKILQEQTINVSIDFYFNENVHIVSKLLNNAKVAFLPFPDGVSERRGSFLAAITNGILVLTYSGKYVTLALKKICSFTTFDCASTDLLKILDNMTSEIYAVMQDEQKKYLLAEFPSSWDDIANSYNVIAQRYNN